MSIHKWEVPKIYQMQTHNQANRNDWKRKPRKKDPIKWLKLPWGHNCFSESTHVSVHTPVLFFLLINISLISLFFSLWEFFFLLSQRVRALSLTTSLLARVRCSYHCDPTSGLETEALLQATACQGHPKSELSHQLFWVFNSPIQPTDLSMCTVSL